MPNAKPLNTRKPARTGRRSLVLLGRLAVHSASALLDANNTAPLDLTVAKARKIIEALACGRPGCRRCRQALKWGRGNVHCPAHDDSTPSFSVASRNGVVLVNCKVGCSQEVVVETLRERGLWPTHDTNGHHDDRVLRERSWLIVEPATGAVVGTHHRRDLGNGEKAVWWSRNGSNGLGGYGSQNLPLYGLDRVMRDVEHGSRIVLCEGEPCADALWSVGIPAVATVCGASVTPTAEVLKPLADNFEVICWQDADDAGRTHMDHVASIITDKLAGIVSTVEWGTDKGADAVDFLERPSVDVDDVVALLAQARPWEPEPVQSTGQGSTMYTAAALRNLTLPEPKFVVPGIISEGLSLLGGKPKLGKSWLALGACVAVAHGGRALGQVEVEAGDVLYLALEDNQRRIQERLRQLQAGWPENLTLAHTWKRQDEGGLVELAAWLDCHPRARLVVIDTLQRIRPHRKRNGDAYAEDYAVGVALKELADKYGIAIVCIVHVRKAAAEDFVDAINATTGLAGAADSVLVLKRERGQHDAALQVTGRDLDEHELALVWDPVVTWSLAGNAEEFRMSQQRAAVIKLLTVAGRPMRPTEVAPLLQKSPNAAKWLLWRMAEDGQVLSTGDGRYMNTTNPANRTNPTNPANADPVSGVSEVSAVSAISEVSDGAQ
jgi:AAA domain